MTDEERLDLMTIATWLYYEKQLTHDEIAQELNLNRVGVTRLLQKARQQGIIKFTITRTLPEQYKLAQELKIKFHLAHAVVVTSDVDENYTLNALGKAGAEFLDRHLFDGCKLGMAWSKTVSSIGPFLHQIRKINDLTIVELAGTYLRQGISYGISWKVSEILQAPLISMPVPVVVRSQEARAAILREENVANALAAASTVDIAVVGIGAVHSAGTSVQAGFMLEDERLQLDKKGVVGEILMRFFNKGGQLVSTDLDERVIGIQWNQLLNIPNVVSIAYGKEKIPAIRAALLSNVIKTLITDTDTASLLL